MKIIETIGVSADEILEKKHNLWIGVSLDNKWFTLDNLRDLIIFALNHTKESVLVWVPGRIQSINLKYFDNLRRAEALKMAFDLEKQKRKEIGEIIDTLDNLLKDKIVLVNYDEICTPHFIKQRESLFHEFAEQKEFYNRVMEIAEEGLKSRGRTVSKDRAESVALYVLEELPLFLDGLRKNGSEDVYTVILYPGMGKLDKLVQDIVGSNQFELLRKELEIQTKTGIASVE